MKAEERAQEVVGRLNAIIDMREAAEVVAGAILAAQREAEDRMKERCAGIEFNVERADTIDYGRGWDNAKSAFRKAIRALPSKYEASCPTG